MSMNGSEILSDRVARKNLGKMLVEDGLITSEQLKDALKQQHEHGGKLTDILVSQGVVSFDELAPVLSIWLNVPLIDLKRHVIQRQALQLIPEDTARKYTLIPLSISGNSLVVVMANPEDIQAIEDINTQVKMKVEPALGIPSEIEQAIDRNYKSSTEIEKQVSQMTPAETAGVEVTPELVARTPIAQTLDLLIAQAVKDRASDVHIEPQETYLRIRYRIDGILHDMSPLPLSVHAPLVSRVKILAGMNIAEQRRPQDGQFQVKVRDKDVDIRAASMETVYGERVTLRILLKSLSFLTMTELGMLPESLDTYQMMMKSPFGLILVGGPTGSGKTTTLYASINALDRKEHNILTIEDPVEYHFADISQTQVNIKAGLTFASGLRSAMRQDPDVILVGEIRDRDTANTGVQAALTGHLVLSSIHANDAVGVLFRLIELGIEPYLISSTLVGTVTQRMVRRLCSHCRAPYKPTAEEEAAYREEMDELPALIYGPGSGCNVCANTGYQGRTGLFEIMVITEKLRVMLTSGASTEELRSQALREGMATMRRDGMSKVRKGITSVSEVLRSVHSIG
jgi:type II secretory ATPase GspE/PulE/Tfp pilus assembly ATPase PilB-like protein